MIDCHHMAGTFLWTTSECVGPYVVAVSTAIRCLWQPLPSHQLPQLCLCTCAHVGARFGLRDTIRSIVSHNMLQQTTVAGFFPLSSQKPALCCICSQESCVP